MRLPLLAFALLTSLNASAQDRVSVATGYATGFESGALHSEVRVRLPLDAHVAIEPMASWTQGFSYGIDILFSPCDPAVFCPSGDAFRAAGARELGVGAAVTYRTSEALPLGLDAAHVGVFAQGMYPMWNGHGKRLGAEIGTAARLGRLVSVGADVQASIFTDAGDGRERFSAVPLLRVSVGR